MKNGKEYPKESVVPLVLNMKGYTFDIYLFIANLVIWTEQNL
jgi:hypothetical protein